MFRRLPMPFHAAAPTPDRGRASLGTGWRRRAEIALAALACVTLGTVVGIGVTILSIRGGTTVGATRIGPWRFWLDAGTPDINPYLRARLALSGEIPLAGAEGLSAFARTDDAGAPLRRACSYRITGSVPSALFWTVEATSADGGPLGNAAQRYAFTATDVLRDATGQFSIAVSPTARPGNWLPLSGTGGFILVLRLYGTALSTAGANNLRAAVLPAISVARCP